MAEQAALTFWYVLASDGGSEHRNMCLVSARVLRHVDRAARIGLLCDPQSAEAAHGAGVRLADVFDEVEVRETGGSTPMLRSRELKLGLRGFVRGDICYLDSDTLLVEPIREMPRAVTGVGMAYDGWWHLRGAVDAPPQVESMYAQIGWPFPPPRYFNGGVIFWRDNATAHQFAAAWAAAWAVSVRAGIPLDQMALAHTDRELGGVIDVLPHRYNAQVGVWPGAARNAAIWHFWHAMYHSHAEPVSLLDHLMVTLARTGTLDLERYDRARAKHYPWVRSRGLRSYVYTRNYLDAIRELPRAVARAVFRGRTN